MIISIFNAATVAALLALSSTVCAQTLHDHSRSSPSSLRVDDVFDHIVIVTLDTYPHAMRVGDSTHGWSLVDVSTDSVVFRDQNNRTYTSNAD